MTTTISDTRPKAKIKHWCAWCGEDILPGEFYSRWVGVFQGDFNCTKLHAECRDASQKCQEDWEQDGFEPEHERGKTIRESEEIQCKRHDMEECSRS